MSAIAAEYVAKIAWDDSAVVAGISALRQKLANIGSGVGTTGIEALLTKAEAGLRSITVTATTAGQSFTAMGGGTQAAGTALSALAARVDEGRAALGNYAKEALDSRGALAELAAKILDAKEKFGSNSTTVKELTASYAQMSVAARGVGVEKAQLASQVKVLETALKAEKAAVDPVAQAFKSLGVTSSASLKQAAVDAQAAYNTIKASGTATSADLVKAQKAVDAALDATKAKIPTLSEAFTQIGSTVKTIGRGVSDFGQDVTKALAPISALGALAILASQDVNTAFRTIRVNTGATGEDLAALKQNFANVFAQVPASAADAGFAIAKLNQLTGAVGPTLEGLAIQELNLAGITGGDLKTQVEATAKAFNNWKISTDQQGPALDTLFKISQLTGTSVTKLAEQVTAGGAAARIAGLNFTETALLMGQLNKAGIDGEAILKGFGLAFKQIAKRDPSADPSAVLQDLITRIKNAGSAAEVNKIAIEGFGRSGIAMGEAIKSGRLNIEDLTKALANSKDTINGVAAQTQTFGEAMTILKNQVELALAPLGRDLTATLKSLMPDLTALINIITQISNGFTSLPQSAQNAVAGFILVAGSIGPIIIGVGTLVALLGGPLTLGLIAVGAATAVLTADWVTSMDKAGSASASFQDGLTTLAKVVGTVMDVIGVFANLQMIAWQAIIGAVTAGIHILQAGADAMRGDFAGAAVEMALSAQAIRDSQRGIAQAWRNVTDEMGGKWAETLQSMVGSAYGAVGAFGAAGRAGASAYSAAFLNINPFQMNPKVAGPAPVASNAQIDAILQAGLGIKPKMAAAGEGAAGAFLDSFGKKLKSGGGPGKIIADAFQGDGGLDRALTLIQANTGKLSSLLDPVTKQFRAQGQQLEKALSAVASNVNDFLSAAGVKSKITVTDLINNWQQFQGIIGKTDAFEHIKQSLEQINIQRLTQGLSGLDSALKINGNEISISVLGLRALATGHQDVIQAAEKAGFTFKEVFPAIGTAVEGAGHKIEEFNTQVVRISGFISTPLGMMPLFTKETYNAAAATQDLGQRLKTTADEGFKAVEREVPGLKESLKQLKEAVEGSFAFDNVKVGNEAAQLVQSVIKEFETEGERMGLTGEALMNHALDGLKKVAPSFPPLMKDVADKSVEQWKLSLYKLPGIWDEVFNKLGSTAKSWAASIFGVLDTIPSAFGSTVKKVTDTINQWAAFFNNILGLLHKFSAAVPSSLGDLVSQIAGVFKNTTSAVTGSLADWTKGLNQTAGKTINATNIMGGATTKMSGTMKTGLEAATGALASFTAAMSVTAATGSKTMGFLASLATSTAAGIQAGLMGGPIAGAIVGGVSLIGGLIGLFMGKSAAQKEKERLDNEKLKADIGKTVQDTLNAALDGIKKALDLAPFVAEFEGPGKAQIQSLFKFMTRLVNNFTVMAKSWSGANLAEVKAAAENIGPVFDTIAAVPQAAIAINTTPNVSDVQIGITFSVLDRIIAAWEVAADTWLNGKAGRIRKVAEKLAPAVNLVVPLTDAIKAVNDVKMPSDESLSIPGLVLDKLITMFNGLAERYAKPLLKAIENVGLKLAPVLSAEKDTVDLITAAATMPVPSAAAADNVATGMRQFIDSLLAAFSDFKTDGLATLAAIIIAITPVASGVKQWTDTAAAVRDYTAVGVEKWQMVASDFHLGAQMIHLMEADAIVIKNEAIAFDMTMHDAKDHLLSGFQAWADALNGAASIENGTLGNLNITQPPATVGGESSSFTPTAFASSTAAAASSFTPSSFSQGGSAAAASSSNSSEGDHFEFHFHGSVIHDKQFEDMVVSALVKAKRKTRDV